MATTLLSNSQGIGALNQNMEVVRKSYDALRSDYERLRADALSPWTEAVRLRVLRRELVGLDAPQVELSVEAQKVSALKTVIQSRATAVIARLDTFRTANGACIIEGAAEIRASAENVAVSVAGITTELEIVTSSLAVMRTAIKSAGRLTSNDFGEERVLQMPRESSDITWTLRRTSLIRRCHQRLSHQPKRKRRGKRRIWKSRLEKSRRHQHLRLIRVSRLHGEFCGLGEGLGSCSQVEWHTWAVFLTESFSLSKGTSAPRRELRQAPNLRLSSDTRKTRTEPCCRFSYGTRGSSHRYSFRLELRQRSVTMCCRSTISRGRASPFSVIDSCLREAGTTVVDLILLATCISAPNLRRTQLYQWKTGTSQDLDS